jgi:alanine racemase
MTRPTTAHIRLSAFADNYRLSKNLSGGKSLAVIKANAYGHGALQCAQAIAHFADGFAVSTLEEAIELREAGIQQPILLLEGFFKAAELSQIVALNCWIVVHARWQVDALMAATLAKPLQVWLKVDTGMHRLGLPPEEFSLIYAQLSAHQNVANIVAMTHFANADHVVSTHTAQQITQFSQTIQPHSIREVSLANSAAILSNATQQTVEKITHWVRPGIMLYGADPLWAQLPSASIKPVMQLTSEIIAIQHVKAGQPIGYGSIFTPKRDSLIGVVACGYADGYPRAAVDAPVAVNGKMTKVVGRVSMDMLTVDVTDIPSANVGAAVELWGDQVSANLVAAAGNTIAYELFCNVKRVKRVYY